STSGYTRPNIRAPSTTRQNRPCVPKPIGKRRQPTTVEWSSSEEDDDDEDDEDDEVFNIEMIEPDTQLQNNSENQVMYTRNRAYRLNLFHSIFMMFTILTTVLGSMSKVTFSITQPILYYPTDRFVIDNDIYAT